MGELRIAARGAAAALRFCNTEKECTVWKKGSRGHGYARAGITMPYDGYRDDLEPATLIAVSGCMLGWTFTRLWYYWACSTKTNPVPQAAATRLNDGMRHQARINGHCNGESVSGPVYGYHVDTVEGLAALLRAISGDRREAVVRGA
jgi:hypothetical protein